MTCKHTEKISLLIDGELPAAERTAIERHILDCGECHEAREDFLHLRSQLLSYDSAIESAAVPAALAKVLSQSDGAVATSGARNWRERFAALFGTDGFSVFSPRLGAVAAILAVAFLLGGIALLRDRPRSEVANNNAAPADTTKPATGTPQIATTPETTAPQDQLVQNFRPKGAKSGAREGRRPRALDNKGTKPVRERNLPVRPPQPRVDDGANYAVLTSPAGPPDSAPVTRVHAETLTASHLEQSELLLRAFRNIRNKAGATPEIRYERGRAQRLLYQNIVLRREAESAGDVQVATLLGSLEPILLDIANLRDKPHNEELSAIKNRVERKSLVPLLQINSAAIARAYE